MKKKEVEKLKTRTVADLSKELLEQREKLWVIERDTREGKIKNVHAGRALRRDIARIMTFIASQKNETIKK